ncbi:ABC transporter permease [Siphonobacter sp. BAB-5385]|uniref:ABC transporter permease n=1 Tax=Siphonobacter sp. BAB-5385 TaxID=1864822 RepID=UPI000B9E4974|nr:ABC transporter permease [Siphonobacter sp. BAB-5385]OZI08985.1 ABC transporter permease [Siphonobacter sp. BAB-5385]
MLRNYIKVALRNLFKHKLYSVVNILGLAIGMAVTLLIGIWVWDELSFNRSFEQYDRIAQVMQHQTLQQQKETWPAVSIPVAAELRNTYGSDFKHVVLSSWNDDHVLSSGTKKLKSDGSFMEPNAPDLLSLRMLAGSRKGLENPSSILLSASLAKALFGTRDPMEQVIKIDNQLSVQVSGVYEDLPSNTSFHNLTFLLPWDLYVSSEEWVKRNLTDWQEYSFQVFVQLSPQAQLDQVSAKLKPLLAVKTRQTSRPEVFLHPMAKWHLYEEFKNGVNTGGSIQYVWLFGLIGFFILLLACINFMNLSTARSEKRAKEVGIRKAIGSVRTQLISQFLSESFLVVFIALVLSLGLVELALPWFNALANKQVSILWTHPVFWSTTLGFCLITALLAGSYPAFYLSSFQPVKVLKGTFKAGRFSALPRKALVMVQFTISITLIIGTIIVYRQIEFAKERPVGYTREGLIAVPMNTPDLYGHYDAIRNDLLQTGAVLEMSESSSAPTRVQSVNFDFTWKGKDPNTKPLFAYIAVTHDFGSTVGWQFVQGRNFSRSHSTDTLGLVINEAAVQQIGFQHPVGEMLQKGGKTYQIIGVIKDMVMDSPFSAARPTLYTLDYGWVNYIDIRINPKLPMRTSLAAIEQVFRKYNPESPFDYRFVSEEYARKFATEDRISQLTSFFAGLTIFISCLGLFGLASYVAEQRTKEIGIRKVLGASVLNLWQLLSKEFVTLVLLSCLLSVLLAYYFMNNWLDHYEYRTTISGWIFFAAGLGALVITVLTVSYQALSAALINPVKSLKSE